ncbi:MAG TPA: cytochrome P450 [Terriglobia bacterium]|nr:cytochrome P450 [Terriglobia bacterium]
MSVSPSQLIPPGPKGHFLLGSLPEIRKDELDFLTRIVREHGDVVRVKVVNIPAYVISRPDLIEYVLITNQKNFIKSVYLTESKALFGEGILTSDGSFWRRQRRMLQPAFHRDRVAVYCRSMVKHAARMLDGWRDGETRDIHRDMMQVTMEIIAHVLFGENISGETQAIGEALGVFFEQFDERFGLYSIPEWLPTPGNLRYRKAMRQLNEKVNAIIHKKRALRQDNGDILSALFEARDENGEGMTETQVRDEMMTLFFTGHETTALALSWAWYLLGQNPRAAEKLEAEVDMVLGGREPTYEDLPRLPYTEMVFKESIRLYPPAYAVVRAAVEDCEIGGYHIRAKSTIAMFPYVTQRDPRTFDRPEEFIPERWENDFQKTLPRCAYFPFGAGPRLCIGDGFAKAEVPLLLAAIAQKYHIELAPDHPVLLSPSLTLRPRKGIKVVIHKRKPATVAARSGTASAATDQAARA